MTNIRTPESILFRGLLFSSSIILSVLIYADITGAHEQKQDIATLGVISCMLHLIQYLFSGESDTERENERK